MAGGKLSPRQRMINMMYLVLTAMLALNVSPHVLEAFVSIEEGFQKSLKIIQGNNGRSYNDFHAAAEKEPEKVKPWLDEADKVRAKTAEVYKTIDSLKYHLVKIGDGEESLALKEDGSVDAAGIQNIKDTNTGTRMLVGSEESKGSGYNLQKKVANYREFLLNDILAKQDTTGMAEKTLISTVKGLLNTERVDSQNTGTQQDWVQSLFYNAPLISDIALLSKIQLDILSTESAMLSYLFLKIGSEDFKFSNVEPVVKANAEYIVKGSTYRAEIFLAAYNSEMESKVVLNNGQEYTSGSDGKVIFEVTPTSAGPVSIPGMIKYMGPKGEEEQPINISYHVIEPVATVSPTKMNVLYSGIANPLAISVGAGVPSDKIRAEVRGGGSIPRQGNAFSITPSAGSKSLEIVVSAEINGSWKPMGTVPFRVKPVPKPTPVLDGASGKSITKGALQSSQGLRAKAPDDFEFDLRFQITSFTVSGTNNQGFSQSETSSNAYFTEKQKRIFAGVQAGGQIVFTDIKASGPSGVVDLPDLVIKVR